MYKKILAFIFSTFFTVSGFSQINSNEDYEEFCYSFISSTLSNKNIDELEKHFDDNLKSESLRENLEIFKSEIIKCDSRSEYLLSIIDRPFLFYNINIYDPKTGSSFGNLRLVFKDQDDFLIDDWIYLIDQNKLESIDSELEELPPASFSNPLPPPPPPH